MIEQDPNDDLSHLVIQDINKINKIDSLDLNHSASYRSASRTRIFKNPLNQTFMGMVILVGSIFAKDQLISKYIDFKADSDVTSNRRFSQIEQANKISADHLQGIIKAIINNEGYLILPTDPTTRAITPFLLSNSVLWLERPAEIRRRKEQLEKELEGTKSLLTGFAVSGLMLAAIGAARLIKKQLP